MWSPLCEEYLFNFCLLNIKPIYFLTFMNNGNSFPSLGGMQLPVSPSASASTKAVASQKVLDF